MRAWVGTLGWLMWIALGGFAYTIQQLSSYLVLSLSAAVALGLIRRSSRRWRDDYRRDFVRQARAGGVGRSELAQLTLACVFWALIPVLSLLNTPAAGLGVPLQLALAGALPAGLALLRIGCELWPRRAPRSRMRLLAYATGALVVSFELGSLFAPVHAEPVELALPFTGRWSVLQGGSAYSFNHHYRVPAQRDALDLMALEDGRAVREAVEQLEDYASWGRPLLAPSAGTVVRAVGDRPDWPIGQRDPAHPAGNHVIIELAPQRYVLLAHLQRNSLSVRAGERVRAGQPVGRCGNSGNTTAPHLHIQVQTHPDLFAKANTTRPIVFRPPPGGSAPERPPRRNDVLDADAPR